MTTTDLSPDKAPAYVPAAVLNSTLRVEPLTCAIGAEVSNVNLGVASRDSGLMAEIRALLLKHKVLFFRDQDITRAEHVAFARLFRRARRPSGGGQRPGSSRPGAHLQVAGHAERPLRERLAYRRDLAREAAVRLRAALRRMSAGRRRHHVGQHGARLREAAGAHQDADRRPARAPQYRSDFRRGHADREAPCA